MSDSDVLFNYRAFDCPRTRSSSIDAADVEFFQERDLLTLGAAKHHLEHMVASTWFLIDGMQFVPSFILADLQRNLRTLQHIDTAVRALHHPDKAKAQQRYFAALRAAEGWAQ
jgi:hypothetical protein